MKALEVIHGERIACSLVVGASDTRPHLGTSGNLNQTGIVCPLGVWDWGCEKESSSEAREVKTRF
jgi:hypothetical protein